MAERQGILASIENDFPQWYQDVLEKAQLADNGPVRGTMVMRPYSYAMWEGMQSAMDARIKATGAENVYLPLFIPQSYLEREAEHVEGFSPELAVVTHAGGKELTEPVVVRPTSETLFGEVMAKWIQSHRDLPLLLNQWANVVRWEMRPRVFLRTTEFLWQEGHTAHATREDAADYARRIHLDVYQDFLENVLAIPVLPGFKTPSERFAGAINTMTCEAMMGDGKALQMATSHELGQNFANAFGITFSDAEGVAQTAWTTSWGSSTRMMGGLIMSHGDASGLVLPPRIAPHQVVVLVVKEDARTLAAARAIVADLTAAGVRVKLDDRTQVGFGRRATEWELKGVPVRIEVGPRDLDAGVLTFVRRDRVGKQQMPATEVASRVPALLDEIQRDLFAVARTRLADRTARVSTVDEAREAARTGFAVIDWNALGEAGEKLLNRDAITVRCLQTREGALPDPHEPEQDLVAVVARAY
ncbi:proline--tRNA ligase [Microbacterium azadirachtae]|uniref:proline--tRNA ligase n=1 Tax=Microbacterium azadirachtae TaxID=582680 RepID=UPI000882CA80|nr:proline--tRNA ligase [Microbacterium azadirachtae]SDL33214.1 prolyl-tRNA synthetase [Microbacterium azadirachtae]SEF63395.1 prolyl-tRNA synthetase [Microbacterium azadirachtae]SEF64249.1 prolyl-tRNA synthetase [Microbacterium azadirachtae]